MTLDDQNKIYTWKEDGEDEDGYYFILSDTLHKCDYNVILVKADKNIMVNGDYINSIPNDIASAIRARLDYFMTVRNVLSKNCKNCKKK